MFARFDSFQLGLVQYRFSPGFKSPPPNPTGVMVGGEALV